MIRNPLKVRGDFLLMWIHNFEIIVDKVFAHIEHECWSGIIYHEVPVDNVPTA